MSAADLTRSQKRALVRARKTTFPSAMTGFLIDPVLLGSIVVGRVYGHIKADPATGRFPDGHLMHTSSVGGFFEHKGL